MTKMEMLFPCWRRSRGTGEARPHRTGDREVFNLGSDEEVTIEELADRVRRITGSSSPIIYIPYEEAYEEGFEDMPRRVPSLEKIHKCIGYCAETSLDQAIERIVKHEQRLLASSARA